MAATVNEKLADSAVHHAVDLAQYSNGVVQRLIALLNRTDPDLMAQLTAALERMPPGSFTVERLESLLYGVRALNKQAFDTIGRELTDELRSLSAHELAYQAELFAATVPPQVVAQVGIVSLDAGQVYAAALARPFQGVLLKEVLTNLDETRARQIRDAVRVGYVENQPIGDIVRRIRGTRAKGYADGLLEAPRRNVEAIVRTAISHTASFARDQFYEANGALVKAVVWTSTLDTRTSLICRERDGKQYTNETHKPIGHKLPWLAGPGRAHWGCRSTSAPVTKSWRELGIPIDDMPPSERASMDGAVPAETTYSQWLAKQSAARQDQVLGPVRGKLLRSGGLTLDKFTNDKGRLLTLDELKERNAAAFKRAKVTA